MQVNKNIITMTGNNTTTNTEKHVTPSKTLMQMSKVLLQ
jgi:hypothetical protein